MKKRLFLQEISAAIIMRYAIILVISILAGCAEVRQSTKPDVVPEVDQEAEHVDYNKELGKKFVEAARKEFTFIKDHEVVTLVNKVGRDILEANGIDATTYHFLLVKKNQLNAFAIPGGFIFIFDGLLKKLDSIDALAGVLAHEIAHVKQDHFFKDSKKVGAINLATMAAVILAGLAGESSGAAGAVAHAANITAQLKFTRENEEEADLFAIKFLENTQYNPAGLAEFFKTLSDHDRFAMETAIPPYLSTHPGVIERRFMVESLVNRPSVKKKPQYSTVWDWERIVTLLLAENSDGGDRSQNHHDKNNGFLSEERKYYLDGLSALKSGKFNKALLEYHEAIKLNPNSSIYHADLATLYMELRQFERASEEALKSLNLSGDYASLYLVLGMIEQTKENFEKSIEYLKKAEDRAADNPSIQFQLARSYHALSDSAKEKFHLGRYYRFNLEPEKAIRQYEKALTFVEENDFFKEKIESDMLELKREGI
jgi:predicted Zn-dependent protease